MDRFYRWKAWLKREYEGGSEGTDADETLGNIRIQEYTISEDVSTLLGLLHRYLNSTISNKLILLLGVFSILLFKTVINSVTCKLAHFSTTFSVNFTGRRFARCWASSAVIRVTKTPEECQYRAKRWCCKRNQQICCGKVSEFENNTLNKTCNIYLT